MRSNRAYILLVLFIASTLGAGSEAQTTNGALQWSLEHASKLSGKMPPAGMQFIAQSEQDKKPTACTLITAAEMTEMLGTTVTAEADDRPGQTKCSYSTAEEFGPYAEVELSWGDGEAGMAGAGIVANQLGTGIVSPYAGLGDQATSAGPLLLIRRGKDLIQLVISGIMDSTGAAKRIYGLLDERLPKSAAPEGDGSGSKTAEAGAAGEKPPEIGFLDGLMEQLGKADGGQLGTLDCPQANSGQQGALKPFGDPSASVVPLANGLTITTAKHDEKGDYELLFAVQSVTPASYMITSSAEYADASGAGTQELTVVRRISLADHRTARCVRAHFRKGDPEEFSGTTVFFSSAVLNELRETGEAAVRLVQPSSLSGLNFEQIVSAKLSRIEPQPVLLPMLVNGREIELPAIHARVQQHDMDILDDPENPIVLRAQRSDGSAELFRVVKIDFPVPGKAAPSIERSLAEGGKAVAYGIYFAFATARIRPESERVLREIADAMRSNPDWQLRIDGHTDSIGDDDANLKLSRERADAVKAALVERYDIAADRLTSDGHGEQAPTATNDTPEGRAQNRRVELTRF